MKPVPLFLVNEKNQKEKIADIFTSPELNSNGLVVGGYTRDPAILGYGKDNAAPINASIKGKLIMTAAGFDDATKLAGFVKYLKGRGKAGVVKTDRSTFYLMPPSSSSEDDEESITCLVAARQQPSSSSSSSSSSKPATATTIAAAKPKPKPSGLLGSLVNKSNSSTTDGARAAMLNKNMQEARDKTVNYITRMETELKVKLQEFAADEEQTLMRLEPMDKDYRYVVHDMVGLFESLLSASCGDMDERHVVIYKKGGPVPEGVEVHINKDEMRQATTHNAAAMKAQARKIEEAQYNVDLRQLQAMSTKVNVNKRDRRTIEELEAEVKNNKKKKPNGAAAVAAAGAGGGEEEDDEDDGE
jgi:hypothetical protein